MSSAKAPLFKNNRTTFERLEKFVSDQYFTDCNLRGRLYGDRESLSKLIHFDCGQNRIPFAEAVQKLEKEGRQVNPGISLGPSWSTHWFKVEIVVPTTWKEQTVHFRWDSDSEALLWSHDGRPLRGLSSEYGKTDFPIWKAGNEPVVFYVEMACNTLFGCGKGGMINPPDPDRKFTLKMAEIAIFRKDVFDLLMDFDVLIGLAKHLPETSSKKFEIMYFANDLVNKCVPTSPETIAECHKRAEEFFNRVSTLESRSSNDFTIFAVGNSHIDTAWLWPYDETKRKCARTFATALHLMEQYPESLRFAVSQAQQLDWVRENYPSLFEGIRRKAAEQKFVGVGGCWVEMDGNLPSGESLVRQMLYGQKFFKDHFGRCCTEFWLPDTFGYPSQLPQLITLAGMRRFVTQKLSWNLVNRFPNQTFWWKGLDGTTVLTHFPPADTYTSVVTVEEAVKIEKDFADKGRSRSALLLYGYGDGGGGPDERMLERLRRMKAAPGIPHVRPATPSEFFAAVERSDLDNLVTWSGELYLELHNGTYTTHGEVKAMNRKCEFLLRDCEFISAVLWASERHGQRIRRNWEPEWKNVLLNQFHDVLPGTSIGQVYRDAKRLYDDTTASTARYFSNPDGRAETDESEGYLLNSLPWTRVVALDGKLYELPSMSLTKPKDVEYIPPDGARLEIFEETNAIVLRNSFISAKIDKATGQLMSLLAFKDGIQHESAPFYDAIRPGHRGNQFMLYDDIPLYWDAWDVMDYHLETGKPCVETKQSVQIIEREPVQCAAKVVISIGSGSEIEQKIILRPEQPYLEFSTKVDWRERHKLLKVQFPFNVQTNEATYEIQFGHIKRPAHRNTSWDSAKFEVCAHKWADVSEFGFGVALLNDCKYGHSCHDGTLSLSLVRGPTAPDADADFQSTQQFTYALMPHFGPLQRPERSRLNVIQAAYELNTPVHLVRLSKSSAPLISGHRWFDVDNPAVMVEAVKVAEDGKSLIVRLYECHGGKALANLFCRFKVVKACRCDLLEDPLEGDVACGLDIDGNKIALILKPFEVITLRLDLA